MISSSTLMARSAKRRSRLRQRAARRAAIDRGCAAIGQPSGTSFALPATTSAPAAFQHHGRSSMPGPSTAGQQLAHQLFRILRRRAAANVRVDLRF